MSHIPILLLLGALLSIPNPGRADTDAQGRTGLSIVESGPNKEGERLFTVQADRIEITDLLRALFRKIDAEVAIDQDVSGPVTLVVKDAPFKDALQWIVQVARPPVKITRSKTDSVYHVSHDAEAMRAANAIHNRMEAFSNSVLAQVPPSVVPGGTGRVGAGPYLACPMTAW